jgi:hypothetical protein
LTTNHITRHIVVFGGLIVTLCMESNIGHTSGVQ